MKKKFSKIILVVIILLFKAPSTIFAANSITVTPATGVSGTYTKGDTFTVQYTATNTASQANTLFFDFTISTGGDGTNAQNFFSLTSSSAVSSNGKQDSLGIGGGLNAFQVMSGPGASLDSQESITYTLNIKVLEAAQERSYSTSVSINAGTDVVGLSGNLTIQATQSSPTPSPSETPPAQTEPEKAPIADVSVPNNFKKQGNKTTDLSKLNKNNAKSVKNLTLDDTENGKIVFNQPIDLSSEAVANKFQNLNRYVIMNKASVQVKSRELKAFANREATVYMYQLQLQLGEDQTPVILKDGESAGDAVSNISYDEESDILSFDVIGFSTYTVQPTLTLDEFATETTDESVTITGSIDDIESEVVITVDDEMYEVEVSDDGTFSQKLELAEGENTITVSATGVSGEETSAEMVITRELEEEENDISTILMVGGVVGFLLLLVLTGIGIFVIKKRRAKKVAKEETNAGKDMQHPQTPEQVQKQE